MSWWTAGAGCAPTGPLTVSVVAVALTAKQRNALPSSAFAYPARRAYPVPTKAQARAARIPERQRVATHRNALARAAQAGTRGSAGHVRRVVAKRHAGTVASVARTHTRSGKSKSKTTGLRPGR